MISAKDAIKIYKLLSKNGIQIWITGGWGIDALLGKQTRPHKDLDVIMFRDDIFQMCDLLSHEGYNKMELWSENLWTIDINGNKIATAFYLKDPEGREFDAHAIILDENGNGVPVWEDDRNFVYKEQDLAGKGLISGFSVNCVSPEMQMFCHSGYDLPDKQKPDLELLHKKFSVDYPDEYLMNNKETE